MAENNEDKTEEPTAKRLEDARKKGQIAFSREVSNFFAIFILSLLVLMLVPLIFRHISAGLRQYLEFSAQEMTFVDFAQISKMAVLQLLGWLAIPLILFSIAGIASSLLQNGFNISYDPITPKLEKISVIKGFQRIFSRRSVIEFLKGIVKIIIVGVIAYYAVAADLTLLDSSQRMEVQDSIYLLKTLSGKILVAATISVFFIALLDFMYQKFEFMKQMRMSKQEIKDEYKQQEGDPHIKGKLKQIRMEKARKRMMAAVPTADVVITNPTHYAVALKYEQEKSAAPMVVAKGTDKIAEKIKQVADENKVPIVRNAALARSLHADCEIEEEIPFTHYQAVAEIISYVYRLKNKNSK